MVRKAIESLYADTCTVIEFQKAKNSDSSTGRAEVTVLKNQPCRLSITTSGHATSAEGANSITQSIKLFIAPEIVIKPGSKIVVTHKGRIESFKQSGIPALYDSHQEIELISVKEWA